MNLINSKKLYKLCFDDSDEFVNFYFEKRYSEKNNITILQNNVIVAALQAIPYTINVFDKIIDISYLSAICTHPDFRKQGLMKKLLAKTYRQLFADGVYATFLIPADLWLFDVYEKNDYETIFFRSKTQINTCNFDIKNDCKIYEYTAANKDETFTYFNKKMNERDCCVQHSFADFEIICQDIYNSNGIILIAECENKIAGISFATRINNDIAITEHFAETAEITNTLLKTISQKTKNDNLLIINLPQKHNIEPFGMMRIINAEKMLTLYAATHPKYETTIFVKDDIIPENTGFYTIANAQCKKTQLHAVENTFNIRQLAWFIFWNKLPYMSLMISE
ncbi:MAG: GNAT family N-acetyltransferase [Prevotellaceae bacterium]|jgi:predicted acetyltransferase|nr:GNAT family N-acetyltransferase [Prevotellaceae bacterium]